MMLDNCTNLKYLFIPEGIKEIESYAFSGCKSLSVINCRIRDIDKLEMDYSTYSQEYTPFSNIPDTCTWRIPSGPAMDIEKYARLYKAQPWWVPTWEITIDNIMEGDVNGDGAVNVADISSIISVMAGEFLSENADVNGDGEVDVADISSVISIMAANARAAEVSSEE